MRYFLGSFLIAIAVLVSYVPSAHAEVYFWQDPVSKVSVTVPDTWRMSHGQKPGDVMTFWAPGVNDHASCRMRVRDDKRFVIYPQRYSDEVQRLNFSKDFWDAYVGEFKDAVVHETRDNAGLGRGFAGYADVSFVTAIGQKVEKRGIAFVSLYGDKAYVLECSAQVQAFNKWYKTFMSVAKSVDFRKSIYEFPGANYRSFLKDANVIIHGEHEADVYYAY